MTVETYYYVKHIALGIAACIATLVGTTIGIMLSETKPNFRIFVIMFGVILCFGIMIGIGGTLVVHALRPH